MGLLIAPTSQDWYEELNETMPEQLPAQCLACSRCSLNLSCDGPFQALSTPRGLGSGRSCSTALPADSQQLAEPPGTGALSLPGQPGVCTGGSVEGTVGGMWKTPGWWARWAVNRLWPPDHSDLLLPVLLPTEISSVTAQAAEPRVSGWGSPGTLGMGAKRREALSLMELPGPLLKFGREWLPCPAVLSQREASYSP